MTAPADKAMSHQTVYTSKPIVSACIPGDFSGNFKPISLPNEALPASGPRSLRWRRIVGNTGNLNLMAVWGSTTPTRSLLPA